jgi:nucleotide-binding universal stress UspA family protein
VFRNILVPLDGSPLAEAALPFASAIAARAGAGLTLVRAAMYQGVFGDVAARQVRAITCCEDYLVGIATGLRTKVVAVSTRVPLGGSPQEWINEESQFAGADLIVMATHTREGLDRWLHGSVAEAVVHRSSVPVMLVGGTADARLAQRLEARQPSLLVPLDGSELADAALPVASRLAHATGARIVLVAAVPKPGQLVAGQGGAIVTYTGPQHAALEAKAWGYLRQRAVRIANIVDVEFDVRYGAAAAEINAAAEHFGAAAVVMASHGRTGPVRSMFGSVTGGVVHGASVPVVVTHPTAVTASAKAAAREAVAHSED